MDTVLIILASVIFISVIGLLIDVSVRFDVGANEGKLIVKLFKIPVFNLDLKVEGNILNLSGKRKKKKPLKFAINKKNLQFIKTIRHNFAHRIYVNSIDVDCFIVLENPALASIISSSIMIFLSIIKLKICEYQHDAKVSTNVLTGFENNEVVALIDLSITISIIDFVWAVAKTIFERREINGKRHREFNH